MAARDSRFFKLFFEPNGAIDQFLRNPNRNFTVVRGYFISKKSMSRLIRYILPRYKVYQDDNALIQQLYLNKNRDFYIRRLLNPTAAPILTQQHLDEFETFSKNLSLDQLQKEVASQNWAAKIEGSFKPPSQASQPAPPLPTPTQIPIMAPTSGEIPKPPEVNNKIAQISQPTPNQKKVDLLYLTRLPQRIPILIKRAIIHNIYPLKALRYYQVKTQTHIKRWLRRYLPTTKLATSLIGASVGGSIAGLPGILAGGVGGWFAPSLISRGAGSLILRGGISLLSGGAIELLVGTGIRAVVSLALVSLPVTMIVIAVIVTTIIVIMIFIQPVTPTTAALLVGNNVASCQFYRGGDPVPATQIANPLLVNKINEISNKIGVPPAIIAGIMRVETGQAITSTSDYISNDYDAHNSKDELGNIVAIGVMQFTPTTFLSTFNNNKNEMQTLFGKTDVSITIDPQTAMGPANTLRIYSITDSIIAAAFKVRADKNSINGAGPWDEATIRKVAERYYGLTQDGTTNYPGYDGSTQNYGNDIWNSYSKCQTTAFNQVAPPYTSTDYQVLHDDILAKFKIDFDRNFSYDYLKWGWEKLWNTSGTKFLSLINPHNEKVEIIRDDSGINKQIGCSKVRVRGKNAFAGSPYPEALFKYVFLHELSHIIENCYPNTAHKTALEQIKNQEGYLTTFAQNSNICLGSVGDTPLNEDFADTLSYYLNQDLPEQSLGIGSACEPQISTNPYAGGRKPLHQQFAQILLGTSNTPVAETDNLATLSCPVVGGGRNRLPSYQADPINGHCGSNYNSKLTKPADQCAGNTRRGKSIDIETGGANGKDVVLPIINGQPVSWQYIDNITLARSDCFEEEILNPTGLGGGCGTGYVFKTDLGSGKNWILHLLHMGTTNLQLRQTYPSGTLIGKTEAIHTHISVGQDIQNPLSQIEPGWLSVDTQLHLCE